ncbi:hypothetical protein [Sulfuricurvum sp.]|uniref:hypothetical protein n=1 Tax=Sulfuricurvum sp. TaxID=2025608 RepID=UPI00260857BE|nr:hypothetical protein [Sulfuricurvum sp.]MDD2265700.1 hypothetical protein [Sulfuricurvum sp.]MDD2784011.1 hypothetical protein [Sulfuricurvum sp.]
MSKRKSHKYHILETIFNHGEKTATDFNYISNANQYMCDLVNKGILKDRWAELGEATVKLRSINDREKAMKFLGYAD